MYIICTMYISKYMNTNIEHRFHIYDAGVDKKVRLDSKSPTSNQKDIVKIREIGKSRGRFCVEGEPEGKQKFETC